MVAITWLLWNLQPAVALLAGGAGYVMSLVFLRPFDAEEMAVLADILPTRLRERLHPQSAKSA
jgi:hypothetical protein